MTPNDYRLLRFAVVLLLSWLGGAGASLLTANDDTKPETYQSPYGIKFTQSDLTGDLDQGLRNDPQQQSSIPHGEWYSPQVRKRYGVWGPPARHYPAPEGIEKRSAAWKRERVLAVGLLYRGYAYQHHHIPDWDPPADWPWKETKHGRNSKGMDCSNFAAFAYNLALGLKPNSDVKKMAELTEVRSADGRVTPIQRIAKPATYAEGQRTLCTGDLLFIRNKEGEISHVVLWVGEIGQSSSNMPLILDSTAMAIKDQNGVVIPNGVQLRPIRENSWYWQSMSHVLRIIADE